MLGLPEEDIDHQINRVVVELMREFDHTVPAPDVRHHVMTSYLRFADARIKSFVPLFVRRQVRSDLRHLVPVFGS